MVKDETLVKLDSSLRSPKCDPSSSVSNECDCSPSESSSYGGGGGGCNAEVPTRALMGGARMEA